MNNKLVTSLELSKELKGLGVKQVSEFYWIIGWERKKGELEVNNFEKIVYGKPPIGSWGIDTKVKGFLMGKGANLETYSAFLSGELGMMLPKRIKYGKYIVPLEYRGKNKYGEHLVCYHIDFHSPIGCQFEKTEAEARGKILAYLKKNNLIK